MTAQWTGGVWDLCSTRCFMDFPRSTVATQLRCTTTSCTRLLCSSPMCQTQAGNCLRGSCRRTAPRGWEWRMTFLNWSTIHSSLQSTGRTWCPRRSHLHSSPQWAVPQTSDTSTPSSPTCPCPPLCAPTPWLWPAASGKQPELFQASHMGLQQTTPSCEHLCPSVQGSDKKRDKSSGLRVLFWLRDHTGAACWRDITQPDKRI